MRLSELLEKMRTDMPDYWLIDEVVCKAQELENALLDARSAMRYIREVHGNLYGVDFNRVDGNANKALNDNESYAQEIFPGTIAALDKIGKF